MLNQNVSSVWAFLLSATAGIPIYKNQSLPFLPLHALFRPPHFRPHPDVLTLYSVKRHRTQPPRSHFAISMLLGLYGMLACTLGTTRLLQVPALGLLTDLLSTITCIPLVVLKLVAPLLADDMKRR